jgi:hypothetical protein
MQLQAEYRSLATARLLLLIVLLGWQSDFIAAAAATSLLPGKSLVAVPASVDDQSQVETLS